MKVIIILNVCAQYSHQRIGTGTGIIGNKRTSGDHPNYNIAEISQNMKKSQELRSRVVAQIPVENYRETLVLKILNE